MTTEIEQYFFEVFGIPPLCCKKYLTNCMRYNCESCENFDNTFSTYPQITDHILLKLICLVGNTDYFLITNEGTPIDIEGLKNSVLHSLTIYSKFHKDLKHQVRELFMEG